METTSKHMAAAEKHNRCVVDAGQFHCPVIDIPPDTICPRCDLIFDDTAELQRHLASVEYPPPEGHSFVINAETSVGACGSDLWQKIRNRWRARRADALRTLSASAGSQSRSLHALDDQARGARVQETERAIARLLGTGGDQGQGTQP